MSGKAEVGRRESRPLDVGERVLEATWDAVDGYSSEPIVVLETQSVLNYIAFGRIDGEHRDNPWTMLTAKMHSDNREYREGAISAARRTLLRAIRRGEVSVFETEETRHKGYRACELWRINPETFSAGLVIYGTCDRGRDGFVIQTHDGATVRHPLFSCEEVSELADGDEVVPDLETLRDTAMVEERGDAKPRLKRRSHTRDYGAPLGRLGARLLALGESEATDIGGESLGSMLAEEFTRLGHKPLDEATSRQMATQFRNGLFAEGAE